jgi:hypothetical protein
MTVCRFLRLDRLAMLPFWAAIACSATLGVRPAAADVAPLSELIADNGSIQVGNLVFDHFTYSQTGQMPPASQVNIAPVTDVNGNVGIRFTGGFTDAYNLSGPQLASDAVITYRLTSLSSPLLGAVVYGDPLVAGTNGTSHDGAMSVTETFFAGSQPYQGDIHDVVSGGVHDLKLYDTINFPATQSIGVVNKGILALNAGGTPTLSFVDQTFVNSVPEPGSMALLGLGGAILLSYGRRRRAA